MERNEKLVLVERPRGAATPQTWRVEHEDVPHVEDGEVLVRTAHLSVEPAMRGWIDDRPSYLPPVELGGVMRASGVGQIVESNHPDFAPGEWVAGYLGAQKLGVMRAASLRRVDLELAPSHVHAGLLSSSGFAAYFGLLDIGKPRSGETVLVSGAAGAVGSIAGQIGKIQGCRVVGIAGGAEKVALLKQGYGFDEAIDYRKGSLDAEIKRTCPEGIDILFDNVGNPILDAALMNLSIGARVVLSGAIGQYNSAKTEGPKNYVALIIKRATMRGFIMSDYADRFEEASIQLVDWWREGRLDYKYELTSGLDQFYTAYERLFSGRNQGKILLQP